MLRTFLLVVNQKTDSIVTFKIDAESGGLSRAEYEVEVSKPAFLKVASL
jgi:6-phosphogluconolactonase (cycloisomerase 2 family)